MSQFEISLQVVWDQDEAGRPWLRWQAVPNLTGDMQESPLRPALREALQASDKGDLASCLGLCEGVLQALHGLHHPTMVDRFIGWWILNTKAGAQYDLAQREGRSPDDAWSTICRAMGPEAEDIPRFLEPAVLGWIH
ncbi:MAG TPA: hypothetical protein VGO93_00250 [Candidatus Xenobia bacterium]|jgi:hypothetical protein